ncbi:phospholipase A1-IIgamma-like [Malania oleifera]|uniref:phospholipase A1-IIgamma-like n=1 Tax=Malania oleifera TaxID=397392 RepID=UPI0025AE72E9|nr:phospholipase A1-IIgamma-like [Malania oleifera]
MSSIAENWKLLSGEKNWEGLLEPLDLNLRRYLIHYGERAGATTDNFIADEKSKNCGLPRFAKRHLFSQVGLENGNPFSYKVTRYLYATSEVSVAGNSNCMGYVAVSTDLGSAVLGRRDIMVAWRGTMRHVEWVINAMAVLVSGSKILGSPNGVDPLVHLGWYSLYTTAEEGSTLNSMSCRDQVLEEVRKLVDTYKDEEISITITGHSLGAALATLNAADIVANGFNRPTSHPEKACLVTAFAFASPRVGNKDFRTLVSDLGVYLHVLRITNLLDPVPKLPPSIPFFKYVDVGEELVVDATKSPYRRENSVQYHGLELYLHAIAGTHGPQGQGKFKLEVKRDIALLNKYSSDLKEEYLVISSWWVAKNTSMVQKDDGFWVLMDHERDEDGFF